MATEEVIERGEAKYLFVGDDDFAGEPGFSVEDTDPDEVGLVLLNDGEEEAWLFLTTEQARGLSNALNRAATRATDPSITTDERIKRHREPDTRAEGGANDG